MKSLIILKILKKIYIKKFDEISVKLMVDTSFNELNLS